MTAPDARQSDELREAVAEALRQHVPLTSWQRDVRAYALTPGEAQAVADAILPVVTAWAAGELPDLMPGLRATHAGVEVVLRTMDEAAGGGIWAVFALAADDRTDPA